MEDCTGMVWGRVQPLRVELAVHFLQIFLRSLLFGAVGGRTLSSCSALMYLPARQWGGGDVRRVFCCVCEQFVVFDTTVDQSSTGEQTSQLLSTAQNRRHSYEWPLEADAEKGFECNFCGLLSSPAGLRLPHLVQFQFASSSWRKKNVE